MGTRHLVGDRTSTHLVKDRTFTLFSILLQISRSKIPPTFPPPFCPPLSPLPWPPFPSVASPPSQYLSLYFAKCKSYPNHFLATTCSAVKPGFPYVNGKNHHHPATTAASTTPLAAHSANIPPRCRVSVLFPVRSTLFFGPPVGFLPWICALTLSSKATGSRLKTNSSRAPVTRAEARCAGR